MKVIGRRHNGIIKKKGTTKWKRRKRCPVLDAKRGNSKTYLICSHIIFSYVHHSVHHFLSIYIFLLRVPSFHLLLFMRLRVKVYHAQFAIHESQLALSRSCQTYLPGLLHHSIIFLCRVHIYTSITIMEPGGGCSYMYTLKY